MPENAKPNNERPADLAVQDSVGGMARRLLNPAHLRDLAGRSVRTLREQGAEQLWRDVKFRVGLAMHHDDWRHRADIPLRRELTDVSYLGLGPRETTADRTAGGKMGAWSYNVRQDFAQNTPVYPQECGSRTDVYRAAVTGSGLNIGIGFAGDGMTFSALPYTPHELENARHLYELPRDDNKTVVRCAAFQRGVGGDNSWGAKPHADDCFAVEKGTSFRFTIQK